MGTNYYLVTKQKPEIPRENFVRLLNGIHIGKSSFGWCFALHVYPEYRINNFKDWNMFIDNPNSKIYNEYGEKFEDKHEFCNTIVNNRYWAGTKRNRNGRGVNSYEKFLNKNYAVEGPNNLLRHKIMENHCIGHGEGTYDYMIGEFS